MSNGEADPERGAGRLRELRARFGARLRERLDRLDVLVGAAQSGSDEGALAEALVVAHRLAGTAGTFGHVEAGEAAAALEGVLRRIADGSPDSCAKDEVAGDDAAGDDAVGDEAAGDDAAGDEAAWGEAMAALARVRAAASSSGLG
jgi:HPt (histidine-containing phosphotransfer) domain-containing protein